MSVGEVSVLSGGASVTGGQDFGADGGNAWRIVGSTNGGATNVLFFVVLVFVLMMVMGMGGAQCQK